MNNIQIFQNPEFGEIRTIVIDNEPWFVGRDLATSLGYAKPETAIRNNVDKGDTLKQGVSDANNHIQQMLVINEAGMYALIFGSKLESAKKFKNWVTREVLPSIRKTGTYTMPQTTDGKIALLAQGHMELKAEVEEIRNDLEALKMDLPILPIEQSLITEAVRKKGVSLLGGRDSKAYKNRGLRQRLYSNLYSNLKYEFGVKSYRAIKRSQTDQALAIIQRYQPPFFLAEIIENENAQERLSM